MDIFVIYVKTFLPAYNSAKIIKIDQDFPELCSEMYCHLLYFTVYVNYCYLFAILMINN